MGYGEEIFTLTAKGFGACVFRLAYARAWEFTTFEEYEEENGYMISIPVRVYKREELNEDGTPISDTTEEADDECNPNFEVCGDGVYDWSLEQRSFKIMGVTAWIRAFFGFDFFSFLPLAIAHTVVANGHYGSANAYMWIERYWAHIAGWVGSIVNMLMAAGLIIADAAKG